MLEEAHSIIYGRGELEYGPPDASTARIAALWRVLFNYHFTEHDVALALICVKLSREKHRPKRDNLVDIAGYAELARRARDEMPRLEPAPTPGRT